LADVVLQAVSRRSDPRQPHSQAWADGHWQLSIQGWPIARAPISWAGHALPRAECNRDALALVVLVYEICERLQARSSSRMLASLPLRRRAWRVLSGRVARLGVSEKQIEGVFHAT
jgi:hypothetical protein